ncbi:MAG: hypothetical protein HY390_00005 [Deltaproteobacteria bacterium]|nr:hypothetical protein [Deltaproteobacteria bacterium]
MNLKLKNTMNTQNEYSELSYMQEGSEIRTFKFKYLSKYKKTSEMRSEKWIFKSNDYEVSKIDEPKFIVRVAGKKKKLDILKEKMDIHVSLAKKVESLGTTEEIKYLPEMGDVDPFLEDWKKARSSINDENKEQVPEISFTSPFAEVLPGNSFKMAQVMPPRAREDGPVSAPPKPRSSSDDEKAYIIDQGSPRPMTLLNMNMIQNQYLSYALAEGRVYSQDVNLDDYSVQILFLDRAGQDGLEDEFSTTLAAQESSREGNHLFSFRVPAESKGFIIAKAYPKADTLKKSPVFVGAYEQNPIFVSKEGIRNVSVRLMPTTEYRAKYNTLYEGLVRDEYTQNPISDVRVWILENQDEQQTNGEGQFQISGLTGDRTYHFVLDKEGYMPLQVAIKQNSQKIKNTFELSPLTKFDRGYDALLGKRMEGKSLLFGKILKEGKPVSKAIVKIQGSSAKVFYERNLELTPIPDPSLFSTDNNGQFIVWNAPPGSHKLDIYLDGVRMASKKIKFSPGVMHLEDLAIP